MPFLARPRDLQRAGVLGLNRRITQLMLPLNPRARYPLVDDKTQTKAVCATCGVAVPETYTVIDRFRMVKDVPRLVAGRRGFVVKPVRGAGGRGVLVVAGQDDRSLVRSTGEIIDWPDLQFHVRGILSGFFAAGAIPDRALIEERVLPHPAFEGLSVNGTPDVRVIVCRGAPVMAMLRLATRESQGRANLHQGGIGAGLDLPSGRTTHAVWRNRAISNHPDTGRSLTGFAVPHWWEVLAAAVKLAKALELGYIGVDLVLDPARGPMVLEANARPGLSIQIATRQGLLAAIRDRADLP